MVTYRKATAEDARAINALIRKVGINPLGINWRRFLVAVGDQDRLVGCGQVKPHRDGSRELASIAVQPAWQGKGIGSALVTRLLREHAPPLYLTCQAQRETFYRQFGFQAIGPEEMPPYFRQIYRLYSTYRRFFPRAGPLRVMKKTA